MTPPAGHGIERHSVLSRRAMLLKLGAGWPVLLRGATAVGLAAAEAPRAGFSADEDAFLDELERATFRFFWECADPVTGLVKDREQAAGDGRASVASLSATGFGLASLCIADQRGWLKPGEARDRARATLRFLHGRMPHEHGFFYHFADWRTGERAGPCELSSIDTAILLCGVLTCREHFLQDGEIRRLAGAIYERVDWAWMTQGGPLLIHGWKPESGFLRSRWDTYCEHMMLYLLAIGAGKHAIPAASWHAWKRPEFEYAGFRFIHDRYAPLLFVHQYSHAWFDFRGRRDRYADYFENSVAATEAHRRFCLGLRGEFPQFSEDLWGITASESPKGYAAWGGPPRTGPVDGTLVPCAAAGSLPFRPAACVRCLRAMRARFGERAWKRYGFVDAFNPATGWFSEHVIGINAGITLLMAENARTGFVWRTFMKNKDVRKGMEKAGFSN